MKKIERLKFESIMIVIVLFVAGVFFYLNFYNQEDIKEEQKEEKKTDNRISPYTNQAIFIEIKRIRSKGIIEQMLDTGTIVKKVNQLEINNKGLVFPKISNIVGKAINGAAFTALIKGSLPGRGWDEKPDFYYGLEVDGDEFYTKDKEVTYSTWDTGYIFNEPYFTVDEETEESDVEITIFEVDSETPIESCKVKYDYRTGRWTGDDYLKDPDGMGHYNGEDYEFWFDIRQTDFDGDAIPYWTEINVLGTDPMIDDRKIDHDGDNCSTAWEWKWDYDPFTWDDHLFLDPDKDGIENVEEQYMYKWLANPYQPEIYIEFDFSQDAPDLRHLGFIPYTLEMEPGKILPLNRPKVVKVKYAGQKVQLFDETKAMLMERFAEHGITLHIDDGCMNEKGGGGDILDLLAPPPVGIKPTDFTISGYYKKNFPDERKGIFRYIVLTVLGGGYNYNMDYQGHYDTMVVSGTSLFWETGQMGYAKTPRAQRIALAVSILHETGHSCGYGYLHCGGVDNLTIEGSAEHWYNYKSVMNYLWYGVRYFDYSDGAHGQNDCDDWGKIDVGFFQRAPGPYDLEGMNFDFAAPPINRR